MNTAKNKRPSKTNFLALALIAGAIFVAAPVWSVDDSALIETTDSLSDTLAVDDSNLTEEATDTGYSTDSTEEHAAGATHDDTEIEDHEQGEDEHGEAEHHVEVHELPNILSLIFGHKANPEITDIQYWENVIFAFFGGLLLVILAQRVHSRRQMIPGKLQNAVEMAVEYFYDFFYAILGEHTKRYMPYLGTLFFYIITMNFLGLVPGFKAASSSLNITVSLALLTFFYAQYVGFKEMGFKGWLDHLAGSPRDTVGWAMVPLLLPIHLIGEIAKPFSLAVRLFGNITGEDVLIYAFVGLGLSMVSGLGSPVGIPVQVIFIPLAILFSTIQALVFTVLSTIYISLMIPQEEH